MVLLRLLVDVDAAGEILVALAREPLQLLARRAAIDARDQHALRLAFGQEPHGFIDAGGAAGEHGDAVRGIGRLAPLPVDAVGEHHEADDEHDQEQDGRVEQQPNGARESAKTPEMAWAVCRLLLLWDVHAQPLTPNLPWRGAE